MPGINLDIIEIETIIAVLKKENHGMAMSKHILSGLGLGTKEFHEKRNKMIDDRTAKNTKVIRKLEAIHQTTMQNRLINEALSIIHKSKN